jgi:hypothetical protein
VQVAAGAVEVDNPNNTSLKALELTSFQGTTLRGLLLEAYAFSVFALIAFWASIASFIAAGLTALLVGLGFWHARRVPENVDLLEPAAGPEREPISA